MSITREESAALEIIETLERLGSDRLPGLAWRVFENDDGQHSYLLTVRRRDYDGRPLELAIGALLPELTNGQVGFLVGLHRNADTLLSLARLGLEAAGAVPARPLWVGWDLGARPRDRCPSCGSTNFGRYRAALSTRARVKRFWCRECDLELLELHGSEADAARAPGSSL